MVKVESILNCRPLTPIVMDPEADVPLTPNYLLLMRDSANYSPGQFTDDDNYSIKRWCQVQYLAQQFWKRWSAEYVQTLQLRTKWQKAKTNFCVGNVALVYDENAPREKWPLGRVTKVFPDRHDKVRQVLVKTVTNIFRRPISKLYKITSDNNESDEC